VDVVRRNRNIIIIILKQRKIIITANKILSGHRRCRVVRCNRKIIIIILEQKKIMIKAIKFLSRHRGCCAAQQKYNNYYFGTEKNNNYGHQNFNHGIVDVVLRNRNIIIIILEQKKIIM